MHALERHVYSLHPGDLLLTLCAATIDHSHAQDISMDATSLPRRKVTVRRTTNPIQNGKPVFVCFHPVLGANVAPVPKLPTNSSVLKRVPLRLGPQNPSLPQPFHPPSLRRSLRSGPGHEPGQARVKPLHHTPPQLAAAGPHPRHLLQDHLRLNTLATKRCLRALCSSIFHKLRASTPSQKNFSGVLTWIFSHPTSSPRRQTLAQVLVSKASHLNTGTSNNTALSRLAPKSSSFRTST